MNWKGFAALYLGLVVAFSLVLWAGVETGKKAAGASSTHVCCLAREGTAVYPIEYVLDGAARFGDDFDYPVSLVCQVSTKPCPEVDGDE